MGITVNEQLAEELYKPVIKKLKGRQIYARFKDNLCTAYFAEMESLSSQNKNVRYLLFMIDVLTKYWVNPLYDKKGITALKAFHEIVLDSNHKPYKLWVDEGRECFNKSLHKW